MNNLAQYMQRNMNTGSLCFFVFPSLGFVGNISIIYLGLAEFL